MEITIKTKFSPGDRVWMPVEGHLEKGRVTKVVLFMADLSMSNEKIVSQSLNYHCIDEHGKEHYYHEYQLTLRKIKQ